MYQKKGFTIVEMILVITGFFLMLTVVVQIYMKMMSLKYSVEAKENLIQNSYYMFEKFNILIKDFTIDYEEYYNRKIVGCDTTGSYNDTFGWNVFGGSKNGKCDLFTNYGNKNSHVGLNSGYHAIYYCSSKIDESDPYQVRYNPSVVYGSGCFSTGYFKRPYYQSYGEYKQQYRDMKKDVDSIKGAAFDDDDDDLGVGPVAVGDQDNVKELYLVSQDGTKRMYLRRSLIATGDWNYDGVLSGDGEYRYNLQMLRLKGFDAGYSHNFSSQSIGVYDGKIDTRVCDYVEGFVCAGSQIDTTIYNGYRMPLNSDDGWVNMFEKNLTISDRNIKVNPNRNPEMARQDDSAQINPYFTISLTNKLYRQIWKKKIQGDSMNNFKVTLQTTFNTKTFYTKY